MILSTEDPAYSLPKLAVPKNIIFTRRLMLRPVTLADVTDKYVKWLEDPTINKYFETRKQTKAEIAEYVTKCNAKETELFAITCEHQYIGNIRLYKPYGRHPLGEIGLFIGEHNWRGKRISTEAIAGVSQYGFDNGLKKISASMYATNLASLRAFLGAGYSIEGIRRKHRLFEDRMTDLFEVGLCFPG